MAFLHDATLVPSKKQLLTAWLSEQEWFTSVEWDPVGSFRLDDPDGQVGMEGFLPAVPTAACSCRSPTAAPRWRAADASLVGTTEHSALGTRWVYDAWHDPVWQAAVIDTIRSGGTQAVEEVEGEGVREPSATVVGSGGPAPARAVRVLGEPPRRRGADRDLGGAARAGCSASATIPTAERSEAEAQGYQSSSDWSVSSGSSSPSDSATTTRSSPISSRKSSGGLT